MVLAALVATAVVVILAVVLKKLVCRDTSDGELKLLELTSKGTAGDMNITRVARLAEKFCWVCMPIVDG
jgi:hypothetical protein